MARHRKESRGKGNRWKRVLGYSGMGLGIVVLAGGGFGFYEYQRLQPANHFENLTNIGQNTASNGASGLTNGTGNTTPSYTDTLPAGVFNVLLLGSDARPSGSGTSLSVSASHTDSVILVHVNLKTHEYYLMALPRDSRVFVPGFGYTKLTSIQILDQSKYGTNQGYVDTVRAISQLVGVPINFYAETNYWGLQSMVDSMGGITMDLPFPVTLTHPWYKADQGMHFTAGNHFLDGKMVTEIVHERDSVPGTNYGRSKLQEVALIGIAKAMMDPANITKLPALAQSVHQYLMTSNLSPSDLVSLAIGVKSDFHPQSQIHFYNVHGTNIVAYNNPLGAYDDEIQLNLTQVRQLAQQHFVN